MAQNEPAWNAIFGSLAESDFQIAIVATGGGTGAIARCFGRPGASRNFVEATVPYSRKSLANYLVSEPRGSNASIARAEQLATTALGRAESLQDCEGLQPAAGVALVAALPTARKRRGRDRIHVASQTVERQTHWSLEMLTREFDREAAESLCDRMLLLALSDLVGLADDVAHSLRKDYRESSIELTASPR